MRCGSIHGAGDWQKRLRAWHLDIYSHLRRRQVGRDEQTRKSLELSCDRAVLRVIVRVPAPWNTGIVTHKTIQVGADTGGCRATDAICGGQEHVEETVVIRFNGSDQAVGVIVNANWGKGNAHLFAKQQGLGVAGEVEVVHKQAPEARRQRHICEDVEVRGNGAAIADTDQLRIAGRFGRAFVWAAAAVRKIGINHRGGGRHRDAREGRAIRWIAIGSNSSHIHGMQWASARGRRDLRNVLVTVEDIDILFAGELVHGATQRIIRDFDLHQVIGRSQRRGLGAIRAGLRVRIKSAGAETTIAEAIVAIHGSAEVGAVAHGTKLRAHQGTFKTGSIRVERQHIFIDPVLKRVAIHVTRHATGRLLPGLCEVLVQQLTFGIRAIRGQFVHAERIARRSRGPAIDGSVQVNVQVGDAGLPIFGGGEARVQFVAGGIVGDCPNDAAVRAWVIRLDAPVEASAQANDWQHVDIHATAKHGGGCRLVIRLIGHTGGLV